MHPWKFSSDRPGRITAADFVQAASTRTLSDSGGSVSSIGGVSKDNGSVSKSKKKKKKGMSLGKMLLVGILTVLLLPFFLLFQRRKSR